MASPSEKLAQSLEVLYKLQKKGYVTIRSKDLTRTHRERLIKNGFLEEVIKGWFIPSRPDITSGESTAWYISFWGFSAAYLNLRFTNKWCLSPEQSLLVQAGNWTVPRQLLIFTAKGDNKVLHLPHKTSLLNVRYKLPAAKDIEIKNGLQIFKLVPALVACTEKFFIQNPTDARAILFMIKDASDVLNLLLEGGHSIIAGRLAGAFRNIGSHQIADDIVNTMHAAGYDVREYDPFSDRSPIIFSSREQSPYVSRMQIMWHEMRSIVINHFPKAPGLPVDLKLYMQKVEETYVTDAYNSLSIEGYQVSRDLIEQVRSGNWNPEKNANDRDQKNALAARGYWQAFQAVKKSINAVIRNANPGEIAQQDHSDWYREMFAPSVTAGILRASDLAGYRNTSVYIRRSMHVPPNRDAVRDLMPAFFQLLKEEQEPAARIVLGHFFFVYIHPYMDGNGRIGRFLMNVMFASGGYPWIVVPVVKRDPYMAALESASVDRNILPFCDFLAALT